MVRYIRNDELYHYGRSINDGAPGVGTGNWRRGGGRSQSAVRQEYYRIRKEERSGIYSENKHQGSYHYLNKLDHQWQEVINASDLEGPINVAAQILKNENFLKRVSQNVTFDQIRHDVNMDWGAPGTTNNCKKCTAAQELRRRGYDVSAGRSFDGGNVAATSYWFNNAVQYKERNLESFSDRLTKVFGNNGRGEVTFTYPSGGGHSVYAYRDQYGYTVSDGQCDRKFTGNSWREAMRKVEEYYGLSGEGTYTCTRLDTATPNWKNLEQDSVLRVLYSNTNMNQMYKPSTKQYGVMYDARSDSVSPGSYQRQISSGKQDGWYGFSSLSSTPTEYGNNYYRLRYGQLYR